MLKLLVSLDLDQQYMDRIESCFPGLEAEKCLDPRPSSVREMEVLLAGEFSKDLFAAAEKLRLIQATSTGVERFLLPEVVASDVILTNARGVHSGPVSDHVFAMIFSFVRGLNKYMKSQAARRWTPGIECNELGGKVIGIVGLGSIGSEIARRAKCFGMEVMAVRRRATESSDLADHVTDSSGLRTLFAKSDFVVLSVPLTQETKGMIGEEELTCMKRDAILVNVSRGGIVQERVLLNALKDNRIGGAGLDVFEEEPLPSNSELWRMENVIITPHVAGDSRNNSSKICDIFCENLSRYAAGRPLINVVDKKAGY